MELGKQIHTLLKNHDEVFVKGLGVFKRTRTPSSFDAKNNVFLPPVSLIEFDPLSTSGYDFIAYQQKVLQVSRVEAEEKIAHEVELLKEGLDTYGHVDLDTLGQLVTYGNSYVFKPLDLSAFNFQAIEAPLSTKAIIEEELAVDTTVEEPITIDPVEKEEEKVSPIIETPYVESATIDPDAIEITKEENEQIINEIASTNTKETNLPTQALEPTEEMTVEKGSSSGNKSFVYGLLAALAVLVAAGVYYYSQYYLPTTKNPVSVPVFDSIPVVDTTRESVDTNLNIVDTTQIDSTKLLEEPKQEIQENVNHKYTIVIGTHRTLAQAYEEAEAFNKDGHKSVRVLTPNLAKNRKRVIWDTYATKEERDSALLYVQKHFKTDAWPDILR